MNVKLTIEASPSVLAIILAAIPKDTASAIMPEVAAAMPSAVVTDEDDDATGGVAGDPASLDAEGLPWDARIHASTRTRTAKNTWTKVRGGPKGAELAAIEAELRARTAAPTVAAPVMPPMTATPAMPAVTAPPAAPVMAPPPTPTPTPMPTQEAVNAAMSIPSGPPKDMADFMTQLQQRMETKRDANGAPMIHPDYLNSLTARIVQAINTANPSAPITMKTIADLAQYPQLIDYTVQVMTQDGTW